MVELASGEPAMAFDAELRVLAWNEAAERLTGIRGSEAVGRFCWEVLGADDEDGGVACHAGCSYGRLAREGWPVPTRRLWIRTSDGKQRVWVTTVALRNGGRPLFLHVMRADEPAAGSRPGPPEAAPAMTPRQRQVLDRLAEGLAAKAIATDLGLSEATVRNHIRSLLLRLGCHSQLEAVAKARRAGLLER